MKILSEEKYLKKVLNDFNEKDIGKLYPLTENSLMGNILYILLKFGTT